MKKIKRILSAVLAAAMISGSAAFVSAAEVAFTDVSNHWAWQRGYIPYLVEKDVLNGYKQSNGTYMFKPDDAVTRAEFIKMLDETFGLTDTISINYSDVAVTDWHYSYFAKAAAQGYILNYGKTVDPDGAISREEATSLLVRYLELSDDDKLSASSFADYYDISSYYRDNVLKAAGAGLINGYEEDNGSFTFRPQNTLTRAEALTILYRAAGAIFTASASSRDSAAFEENAVIKTGNITIQNQTLKGRVIVSEGADNGTIGFYSSKINDALYIRGGANVTIAATTADTVVVDSDDIINLSVIESSTIKNLIVNERCAVMLAAGSTVENLIVNSEANLVSITGSGTIKNAEINANNFSSSMVPEEFEIATGLTATFNKTSYEGSSSSQEAFVVTPFVTVENGLYYVNVLPVTDGVVRCYYSNSSYCPTISNFDSYYSSATYRTSFNVSANSAKTEVTFEGSEVASYGYAVLQLQSNGRYYPPVIVPNSDTSGTGFSTDPYLYTESSIKFTASASGTVYYMYSDVGTHMNTNEFLVAYNAQSKELKGEAQGSSIRATTVAINSKYASVNQYMIFMFKSTTGLYYTPVVVSLGDDGFAEDPSVTTPGTIDFTTSVSGTLYYYYSYTDDLPSPDKFNAAYREADYRDTVDVTKNRSASLDYKTRYADKYPYIIMCIRTTDSEFMQPVAVSINYDPGFDTLPEVINDTTIRFESSYNGTVYYYYTKSAKAPSPADFDDIYDDTSSRLRDSVSVVGGQYTRISYDATRASTYPYMAIMLVDKNKNSYQPVVVSLQTTSNTGFTTSPYVYDDEVYFKTSADCEVWWYYARTNDSVSASEFYDGWKTAVYGYSTSVKGGSTSSFAYRESFLDKYPYIVISTSADEDSEVFTYPVILNVKEDNQSTTGSALKVSSIGSNTIYLNAFDDGYVYYYETDEYSIPSNSDFSYVYMKTSSDYSGRTSAKNGADNVEIPFSGKYKYVMIQLESEDSRGNEVLYNVLCVNVSDKSSSGDDSGSSDGATKVGYGFALKDIDPRARTVTILPEYSGTVTVSLGTANYGSVFGTSTYTVTKGEEVEISYPNGSMVGKLDLYLYIQLTDTSGNVYQRYGGIQLLED